MSDFRGNLSFRDIVCLSLHSGFRFMDGRSAAHFASGLKLISDPRGASRTISTDDHAERCREYF